MMHTGILADLSHICKQMVLRTWLPVTQKMHAAAKAFLD
jgi:hypothetical protein